MCFPYGKTQEQEMEHIEQDVWFGYSLGKNISTNKFLHSPQITVSVNKVKLKFI